MASHIVASFEAELQQLNALVVDMGALVCGQISEASDALRTHDTRHAEKVVASDKIVDSLHRRIEDQVIQIIARRTPVAIDLRQVIATLKIATDLERMGDLAKNNAKRVTAIEAANRPAHIGANLDVMSERVAEQVSDVMQAFARRDRALAQSVWMKDGDIDTLQNALFRELVTYMMEDPRSIGYCAHLLFCAKNLERIGDHATNIAEDVHFIATGAFLPGERPRGQDGSDEVVPRLPSQS